MTRSEARFNSNAHILTSFGLSTLTSPPNLTYNVQHHIRLFIHHQHGWIYHHRWIFILYFKFLRYLVHYRHWYRWIFKFLH